MDPWTAEDARYCLRHSDRPIDRVPRRWPECRSPRCGWCSWLSARCPGGGLWWRCHGTPPDPGPSRLLLLLMGRMYLVEWGGWLDSWGFCKLHSGVFMFYKIYRKNI